MDYPLIVYILLFAIACLYSSVGHGGASGYLALMGLYGVASSTARPVALLLNCFVSVIAFLQFFSKGFFNLRLFLWLACISVPMAYLGSQWELSDVLYKKILGALLLLTSIRFFIPMNKNADLIVVPIYYVLLAGASIGFISGLIGIGGGILLSPLLIFFRWADVKTSAGISALFIFVNSASGLIGLSHKGIVWSTDMQWMLGVALAGGLVGSFFGARYVENSKLKIILGVALCIASVKLIFL